MRMVGAVIAALVLIGTAGAAESVQAGKPEVFGKRYPCNPGPWGDLEYYYIYLEAPDSALEDLLRPDPMPRWSFSGGTDAKLRALFETAKLSSALQDYLLNPKRRILEDDVLTVFPPLPDLVAMTSEQRTIIYRELAKSELNRLHASPIYIAGGDAGAWLGQSRLRPELSEAVKKMTYMRGDMLCFSDVAAVLAMVESEKEAKDLMKTLSRTRSLVLQLNVKAGSDFRQTIRYWSGNRQNERIESIILPAAEAEDVKRLDCVHLLPPLPRRYLYSYPSEELPVSSRMPDCIWTSLNFFSATPLNYHMDGQVLRKQLIEDYEIVNPPYSFGDVLMFSSPDGSALHLCVYLADDIVYTKNGESRACPWILMKIGELRSLYSSGQPTTIRGYRLASRRHSARNGN